jgi:ligand-binding sensor domain-containing protein
MTHPPNNTSKRLAACRFLLVSILALLTLNACLSIAAERGRWTYFENHSDIRALYEDGDTLWAATNGGVLLVNTLTGDVVAAIDAASGLPSNSVRALCEQEGRIYVGTDEGLSACRWRRGSGGSGKVLSCEKAGTYRDVRDVSFGPSGTLYVGTFGHGVAETEGRKTKWVTTADSLLDNRVFAVREGVDGTVFYATSMGLCARTTVAWMSYQAGTGLPRGEVRDLVDARTPGYDRGRLSPAYFVLVAGRGVFRFDGRRALGVLPGELFRENDVAGIAVTEDGTLWAAGRYGKVASFRDGVWTEVGEGDEAIANARWRCVHVGASGIVYFGSADGLIAAIDEQGVRKVSIPSGFPSGCVGPMAEDMSGRVYMAAGPDLVSTGDDTSGFALEKNFGSVLAIAVSPDGVVWVNGRWGLYRKQSDGWASVHTDIDPVSPLFRSLAFDSSGCLWAGTESGEIFAFDGKVWVRFADRVELSGEAVERLAVDRRGYVWALSGSRAYSFDGSGWTRFDAASLDSAGVIDLAVRPSGDPAVLTRRQLWSYTDGLGWRTTGTPAPGERGEFRMVAFDGHGRTYLATDKGVRISGDGGSLWIGPDEGLRGQEVTSLLADGRGFLWVGFRRDGLSRISLEKLWK